ncbi:MAG: Rpn family recombination-promoting nuclease/putative transposase [Isosphaeraceae bacterium]
MSKHFDALTRSLLEKYPADWLNQLGLIHGEPVRVMNPDLSTVSAEADKVIRVDDPEPWLVHIELQTGYDSTLPRRLLRYNAMLNVKHDLPVHTVAILLHPGADGRELTGVLRQQSPDGRCWVEFWYHLVRAWLWDTEALLAGGVGLLPLAPLCARAPEDVPIIVERMKERVDPAAVTAEISELWTSAAIMAGLRFPWELIKHCFGGITAMRESSTIQAFIEEGRQKGLQEGLQEGRSEGQAEEARKVILLQGPMRFGAASQEVKTRLEEIHDLEYLEAMIKHIMTASSWDELLDRD